MTDPLDLCARRCGLAYCRLRTCVIFDQQRDGEPR